MSGVKKTWDTLLFPYVGYVMYFLGVGLISGSIVHLPLDPVRYSIILVSGIILFIVASFLNELFIEKKKLSVSAVIRLIVFSLFLSLGIGMMSGAIQHFQEIKEYASYLIPVGFVMSLLSFVFKSDSRLDMRQVGLVLAICLVIGGSLQVYLGYVVGESVPAHGHDNHDSDSHSH